MQGGLQNISPKKKWKNWKKIFILSEFHASKGHGEQIIELDNRFHEILYQASDSKMLEHWLRDFHQYVKVARKQTLIQSERGMASNPGTSSNYGSYTG